MQKEIWKSIKNYENLYEVSNYGNVKRLAGEVSRKNGGIHKVKERIMTPTINASGYLTVSLTKANKMKRILIHRLVAEAFIPNSDPINKNFVNHKDFNRKNPHVDNLEWVTPAENIIHAFNERKKQKKQFTFKLYFPEDQKEIWKAVKNYEGFYEISSLGKVKRLKTKTTNERLLTPFLYKETHFVVKLTKNGKSKTVYLHKLIAETFISNPENKSIVHHIDFNRGHNSIKNLQWINRSEYENITSGKKSLPIKSASIIKDNNELWKDIKAYEGYFQVSNFGRVRSLDRIVVDKLGRKVHYKGYLKAQRLKSDYVFVVLSKNGKQKDFPVHRLVADAFISNPENKPFVNHINADTQDNRLENLEWATPKENAEHTSSLDRTKNKIVYQYDLQGNFIQEFPSAKKASKHYDMVYGTLLAALSDNHYACGYQWKFADDSTPIGEYVDAREKRVMQYSMDGTYIQTFVSIADAETFLQKNGVPNANAANISKACTGVRNYSYEFQWRHEGDERPLQTLRKKVKSIVQLSLNGEFIKTHEHIRAAEIHLNLNLNTSGIGKCCRGKGKSAHGFKWMYEEDYKNSIL